MRQTSVFIPFFAIVLLFFPDTLCWAMDAETQKVLTRLEKLWEIQKSEIVTAHIVFRQAHGQKLAVNTMKPLIPQQVEDVVYSIDYSSPENAFEQLIAKLLNNVTMPSGISNTEIFYASPKYLVRSAIPPQYAEQNNTSLEFETNVFDGNQRIEVYPLNNQVYILKPEMRFSLDVFRLSAPFRRKDAIKKSQFSLSLEGLRSTHETSDWIGTMLFDVESGITKDLKSLDKPEKSGDNIGRSRYERCLFTTSSSIVFPRLSVQVEFEKKKQLLQKSF
ncbi:MAG: hypothetical protein LBU65_03345 [Planctomycetaceae bacterium]|jgi:hypothetical protein|nr:hypothetical protein [Planctomycetaceae bacterium]